MPVTDLRWEKVWAHIKKFDPIDAVTQEDGSPDPRLNTTDVLVEVLFDGWYFYGKINISEMQILEFPEVLNEALDQIVLMIDQYLFDNGFLPYEIRSE